jgi:hypothetical protein
MDAELQGDAAAPEYRQLQTVSSDESVTTGAGDQ